MIQWNPLTTINQIDTIDELSLHKPVAIFKHSTSCSISSMSKMRLESSWNYDNDHLPIFYLDLLKYRPISNAIAERYQVHHESPQLILLSKGECIYDGSHFDITVKEVEEALNYNKITLQ